MSDFALLKQVSKKTLTLEGEIKATLSEIGDLQEALKNQQAQHAQDTDLAANDTQAAEVIKVLFDKVSEKGFQFLENLGTQALRIVFPDETYSFKIVMGSRGQERTASFMINDGKKDVPLAECGGGPQVLMGFIFQVYFILQNNLRRLMVMDETFAQLSPHYLDGLLQFLFNLVEHLQFKFLWISHSPYLEGKVTKFFTMSRGKLTQR